MTCRTPIAAALLACAAGAAWAQPALPAFGEMPWTDGAAAHPAEAPVSRAAVRATAIAKDLEVGEVTRPVETGAPAATPGVTRQAAPRPLPLSGERA